MKLRIPLSDKETVISDFAAYNFFLWLNLLVFFDRGIIPGAISEFNEFIADSTGSSQPDILFGVLQAFFVLGLVLGALALSYSVVRYDRFRLATIALAVWVFAVILSGISYYARSYGLLLFARTLAGFGEASILFDIPSWIQSVAPSSHRGTWLGIFYTAIPLGTTLGFGYSSAIAKSSVSWSFSFFMEAGLAFPLIFFLGSITDDSPEEDDSGHAHTKHSKEMDEVEDEEESPDHQRDDDYATLEYGPTKSILHDKAVPTHKSIKVSRTGSIVVVTRNRRNSSLQMVLSRVTLVDGLKKAMSSPVFVSILLAGSAQAAAMAAWGTFGSAILMNLGYYESEVASSTAFGILISMAGLIGTPLGGYALDWLDPGGYSDNGTQRHVYVYYRRQPFLHTTEEQEAGESDDERSDSQKTDSGSGKTVAPNDRRHLYIFSQRACAFLYWMSMLSFLCFIVSVFAKSKGLFLFLLTMGFLLIHATSAAVAVIQAVELKHSYQCIASEIAIFLSHLFGDVPAMILTGILKAVLAPSCAIACTGPACQEQASDLRWVVFYIGLWLFAAMLCTFIAWRRCSDIFYRKVAELNRQKQESERSKREKHKKLHGRKKKSTKATASKKPIELRSLLAP